MSGKEELKGGREQLLNQGHEHIEDEVVLDPTVAHMLGRGLSQLFDWPLANIEERARSLTAQHPEAHTQILNGAEGIRNLMHQLQTAKTVKLVIAATGFYAFWFSPEQAEKLPEIPQGAVVLTAELTKGITDAVSHSMRNDLTVVAGFADLIVKDENAGFLSKSHASGTLNIAEAMAETVSAIKQVDQLVLNHEAGGVRLYSATPIRPSTPISPRR